ncbi:DUF5067 domain-containing protein [Staphylococcus sp. GSSP0090]|nr:DUF5067 domain-containing protein [Staphylococcus sp. GSSP0090]
MKKLFCLLFASILVLSACAAKEDSSNKNSESNKETASNKETKEESGNTDSVDVEDDSEEQSDKSDSTFKDDQLTSEAFDIKLKDTKLVKASEYEDDENPSIAIIYSVKNKEDKDLTASAAFYEAFDVYQNSKNVKRDLKTGGGYDSDLYKKYEDASTDKINKDGEVEAVQFFKLKDTKTPVTLQAKDPENYEKDNIGTKEIKLN